MTRTRTPAHDLVLFGATGFTGRLVAEYLAGKHQRFALAGRDRTKLEALRRELGLPQETPILIGDARDAASLEAIVKQAKVVCTTVGPYAKYGSALVAACAKNGVDYCDLAGETQWIRRMVDEHHDEAAKSGARIVHCCGFDSLPSDLGVLMLQEHAKKTHGAPCDTITFALRKTRGGFSGGTVASMLNIMEEAKRDRSVRKVLGDPYALNPPGERSGPDGGDQRGVAFDKDLNGWTAPFVMAAINTRIVRRTNALGGYPYGRSFRYREVMSFPKGARGLAMATGVTAALGGFVAAAALPGIGSLVHRAVPKPGEGPSAEARASGFFEILLVGRGRDFTVRGTVAGKGDPGYGATAVMLSEAALCLAGEERKTGGGVLTPAYAMGLPLIERLRAAGMQLTV